jgi:hypothetical protein
LLFLFVAQDIAHAEGAYKGSSRSQCPGLAERRPCLIVDESPGGFRLRGVSSRLRRGQVVEVILDQDPSKAVRCSVIWTGQPGTKQEGEAGLEIV